MIRIVVHGTPIGKARARTVTQRNGRVHAYTPDETAVWQDVIRCEALRSRPTAPLEGPLYVKLVFYLPRPRTAKRAWPSVKPDLDNLEKAVLDALNRLIWRDDAQIVSKVSTKRYGYPARVEITVEELMHSGQLDSETP